MVATDYSEAAKDVVDKYTSNHPGVMIELWNQRQLVSRLGRHPHLSLRYNLPLTIADYSSVLSLIKRGPVRTLLISDQSAVAHNLTSALRAAGFNITFVSFWNYSDKSRLQLNLNSVLRDDFRLVIFFLGDSFVLPLPQGLLNVIERCSKRGSAFLLFPFLAWTVKNGLYPTIQEILPVTLQDPTISTELALERLTGSYRHGDFRWMLSFDSFAEDEYTEFEPSEGVAPFTDRVETRFGIAHSFEYLDLKKNAQLAWADTSGNPMVVISEAAGRRVCYLNTCGHSCMTPIAISSPFEAAPQFGYLVKNILEWLLNE